MAEDITYTPKGQPTGNGIRGRTVTGADGKSYRFVAGQPVAADKVPESVLAAVREDGTNFNTEGDQAGRRSRQAQGGSE